MGCALSKHARPRANRPTVCDFQLPNVCSFQLPLTLLPNEILRLRFAARRMTVGGLHTVSLRRVGGDSAGVRGRMPSPKPTWMYSRRPLNLPPPDGDGSKPKPVTQRDSATPLRCAQNDGKGSAHCESPSGGVGCGGRASHGWRARSLQGRIHSVRCTPHRQTATDRSPNPAVTDRSSTPAVADRSFSPRTTDRSHYPDWT